MLYKIIIVDDEKNIREGLSEFVDWNSLGFEVLAAFGDGQDALEYIKNHPLDVVLTDIKIPFVSGLEIARFVYENIPKTKVVLISAYKEFDFAKQAIDYNVVNYLLKPTQIDEIESLFSSIKNQLDFQAAEEKRLKQKRQQYDTLIPALREQFFSDIISGALKNEEEIIERSKVIRLGIDYEKSKCCIVNIKLISGGLMETRKTKYGEDYFAAVIKNFFKIEIGDTLYFPIFGTHDSIDVLIISPMITDEDILKKSLETHFDCIKSEIKSMFGAEILVTIYPVFKNVFELAASRENLKGKGLDDIAKIVEKQKVFISSIDCGEPKYIIDSFNDYINEFENVNMDLVYNFLDALFVVLNNKLKELNIDWSVNNKEIYQFKNIDKLKAWSNSLLNKMTLFMQNNKPISNSAVIKKAKGFVQLNYNKNITLNDIANEVFLSPVYFSRIFKQYTGENFSNYLINVRIQKAIELLENPQYKVYEIGAMVGYKTTKYFYKIFKSCTGYTPTEYRFNLIKKVGLDEQQKA
ncbi:MAG: response regulator [Firmicutes bacterium]|nr:response regulator [Bacillota bacterium]